MLKTVGGKGLHNGGASGTTTFTEQNTWTDAFTGAETSRGSFSLLRISTVLGAGTTVTVQAYKNGAWVDVADTAGVANGGTMLKPFDTLVLLPGDTIRVGVKTGNYGASTTVTLG